MVNLVLPQEVGDRWRKKANIFFPSFSSTSSTLPMLPLSLFSFIFLHLSLFPSRSYIPDPPSYYVVVDLPPWSNELSIACGLQLIGPPASPPPLAPPPFAGTLSQPRHLVKLVFGLQVPILALL